MITEKNIFMKVIGWRILDNIWTKKELNAEI